jgi:hypothetical protein
VSEPVVPALVCPAGWLNVGGECVTGQACPVGTAFEDGCCVYKECPPSYVSIGGRCVPPPVICKIGETYANGRCMPAACPPGLVVTPPKNGTNGPRVPSILKGGGTTNGLVTNGQATGELRPLCPDGKPAVDGRCPPAGDSGKKICAGASYCSCPDGSRPDKDGKCERTPPPDPALCPVPPLTIVDGKCCAPPRGPLPSPTLSCYSKPAGMGCSFFDLEVNATTCCLTTTGECPAPPDVCANGTVRVCRGDGPFKACSCEPEKKSDQCPAGTIRQCTGTDPKLTCTCVAETPPAPPPTDVCRMGTVLVCRGEGPLKACSCEPEKQVDQCPSGTMRQCTGTRPNVTCTCVAETPPAPPPTTKPKPEECQFPNVLVDGVCCKAGDFRAGKCGEQPPSPARGDCSIWDVLRGTCARSPKPPPVTADCTRQRQLRGECLRAPPSSQPPTDPPGAQLGYCPSLFRMVGTSCCNLLSAGQCYPNTGGIACQSGYNSVGEGFSAQCCRQSAVRCTVRSASASCASGEIPIQDGSVSACCREDPAGSCVPPSTPTPNIEVTTPLVGECGGWEWVPIIGFFVCRDWPGVAGGCSADNQCPRGTYCRQGSCTQGADPSEPSAPSATGGWPNLSPPPPALACTRDADCPAHHDCPGGMMRCGEGVCRCRQLTQPASACSPPSTLVNGQCCAPEAVAAGTCGAPPPPPSGCPAGLFPSNDGKTCCTKEQITRETCGAPPPAPPQKAKTTTKPKTIPVKPKEIVCQKGFHLEGGRCVADAKPQASPGFDFQIGIGIGGGGRRGGSPGGGAPKPPSPPKPN